MPRLAAWRLCQAVLDKTLPLDEALAAEPRLPHLEARDRAFARTLVMSVLRHLGEIDALIAACLERPLPASARPARHLLRLGVAQLLFLDVPDHAVVDTAVTLARHPRSGATAHAKLINAVLRRLAREGRDRLTGLDGPGLNTPPWLMADWRDRFGADSATAIAAANATEPALDITLRDPSETAAWAERLGADVLPAGSLRLASGGGRIEDLPGYTEGAWWVQDAAAALPVRLLGDIRDLDVVDLCAAPGGKTLQLAGGGAKVTAVDRSAKRLERLHQNLKRCRMKARVETADAADWRPEQPVDLVLLDAPCSATGTLRRHPEIAHHRGPADVDKLAKLQSRLIQSALAMLKPGGRLLFCTCSLQQAEGPDHLTAFQDRREPLTPPDGWPGNWFNEGALTTRPDQGLDGFFAALFRA
ncbi:MAG: RsmB/NOP family class I SAM-dependent RNA methyltransferase [Rhodospirillales bacterium]